MFIDNPCTNFESWCAVGLCGDQKKLWLLCFYVVVWSLWEMRNSVVFRNENVCFDSFMIKVVNRCRLWLEASSK